MAERHRGVEAPVTLPAEFPDHWRSLHGVYGGYVIAVLGAAAQEATELDPELKPVSLAADFTSAVLPEDGDLEVTVVHQGRQTASIEVVLLQGHRRASARVKLARIGDRASFGPSVDLSGIAPPETLSTFVPSYGVPAYGQFLELRRPPIGDGRAAPAGYWVRLIEDAAAVAALDEIGRAAVLLDALPPTLFCSDPAPHFVPTIDFGLHLAPQLPHPVDGWYYADIVTGWSTDGFCMEDARLYTSAGTVVAQVRQNRRIVWADRRGQDGWSKTTTEPIT